MSDVKKIISEALKQSSKDTCDIELGNAIALAGIYGDKMVNENVSLNQIVDYARMFFLDVTLPKKFVTSLKQKKVKNE